MNLVPEIRTDQKRNLETLPLTLHPFLLQNLDSVLLVRKIFFNIQVFHRQFLFRYSHILLHLRYVKYIMHVRQLWQQLQLVDYFTSLLQNLEWSNEPQCELTSDLETTQTSHR
jgi:hypothetical protein